MFSAIYLIIIIISGYILVQPFFRSTPAVAISTNGNADLKYRKQELLRELKEIEFDYHMGKLSEEDYHELTREYKLRAAQVLQELKGVQPAAPEQEKETSDCPACQSPLPDGAQFCPQCGTQLGENHA
ncbi:MAG: zinc ribbon domain-containing protein [Candidatus Marinimicrobia bacterium]|nr:zinc ribbon domain-containing protein [Candidatus Neomarinimicrobiota bacterium]MCF7830337.1 zinc ribbon domain-containing protein [Candidatus Neomarinimicrobiota bacterium]MCF7882406.1 zinc ribbon domain-containing protein [Candidatus Neomarinimicrobiota bacterium]